MKKIINSNSISLHVRRGDYENNSSAKRLHGGICTLNYYKQAIELVASRIKNPVFFIFSNDLKWARENLELEKYKQVLVNLNKGNNSYKDMYLMSKCKHNIIANSSFSWWGAWLNANPKKIVICPKRWYNNKRLDSKDIVPESWIRI